MLSKKIEQIILDENRNIAIENYFDVESLNGCIIATSELQSKLEERKKQSFAFNESPENLANGDKKEKWSFYPLEIKTKKVDTLEVSNFGRVKVNGQICVQEDKKNKIGYLIVKEYPSLGMVWDLVANTWLKKPACACEDCIYDVHHITNNGYDNTPENLIWLKKCTHLKINHKTRV
jgi:hypothetical protein